VVLPLWRMDHADRSEPASLDAHGPAGPPTLRALARYLGAVTACELVGAAGAVVTVPAVRSWLPSLDRPRFQPPDAVFGPVWTLLYALMGISWARVRGAPQGGERRSAERWLAIQLVLNGLWSFLFFGRRRIPLALVDSAVLVIAVALALRAVWRVSTWAGLLLLPYLAWVLFATVLNASLWRRNRCRP